MKKSIKIIFYLFMFFGIPLVLFVNRFKCELGVFRKNFGFEFNDYRKQNGIPLIEPYFKPYYKAETESNDWRDSTKTYTHYQKIVNVNCNDIVSEVDFYKQNGVQLSKTTIYPENLTSSKEFQFEFHQIVNSRDKIITEKEFYRLYSIQ